jgi:glycosyltransferase involved in cell wall biosynthesis
MQILVLGMHRSGTSVVARLLNMMGAYFAPDDVVMQPSDANPKGYWEREDIRVLNDDILKSLNVSWDNLYDFDASMLTEDIQKEFLPRIQQIVLNLDAHRPWMIKDPRMCLLLPVWRSLLEVPVCVFVYRNPIQIAQSLKTREDMMSVIIGASLHPIRAADYSETAIKFPITLGMALWEKYTLDALTNSEGLPRIFISFHELMSQPVETIKNLYNHLTACDVQGLRLPSEKEILAYIEPKLFREKGDLQLQNTYINTQQAELVEAFQEGTIFEFEPLPNLSLGASEVLEEYQNKRQAAERILFDRQEIAKRDHGIAKRDHEIALRDQEIVKRNEDIHERNREIARYVEELNLRQAEITHRNDEIAKRNDEIVKRNDEIVKRDEEIAQRDQQLANSEAEIVKRDQELANSEAEIVKRDQELAQRVQEIAHYQNKIAQYQAEVANYQETVIHLETQRENVTLALQKQEQETNHYQQQAQNNEAQWVNAEQRVIKFQQDNNELHQNLQTYEEHLIELQNHIAGREHQVSEQAQQIADLTHQLQLQEQNAHKLTYFVSALGDDIVSAFNSLSWKIGRFFTRLVFALTFRKPGLTAEDHINSLLADIEVWNSRKDSASNSVAPINTTVNQPPVPLLTTLKKKALKHDPRDYPLWIKNYDTLNTKMLTSMQERIEQWPIKPLISIVMPTYNSEEKWLREAIESVQQQIYPHWELCIADDASTQPHVRSILEEYVERDPRIKVQLRTENGHISAASNTALEMVTGEFVAFLDHDDRLARVALFWVADAILEHPEIMLWYSDEDKLNQNGERVDPYFKPDWNPDLFLSHNYITHLIIYRTDLVKKLGGFREGYEGSQDYDLALRALEQIKPTQIYHIPRVLYHWRVTSGSTALHGSEKPYTITAAQKAISEHLERRGIDAKVMESPLFAGTIRVEYQLPPNPPLVTLIIPTYNGLEVLRVCIESVLSQTDYPNFDILIVNNNSDDPATLAYFRQLEADGQARVFDYPHPFNYPAINNAAVEQAGGELICLLNNDIEIISPGWLTEMVSHALRPEIGAVGARLWYPDDRLQHGGVIVGLGGVAGHSHKYMLRQHLGYFGRIALIQNLSAVTAACLVMRKDIYLAVDGLDAENLPVAFNDVDFCLRIKEAGWRILWTPHADMYHHESASRGVENTPEKIKRFQSECIYMKKRWGEGLLKDPAYSPNLTLETEDFSYAWPPRVLSI